MAQGNLTLSSNRAETYSTWNGYQSGYGEIRYTTPSTDSQTITVSIPASMANASFNSVTLSYSLDSASGTRSIKFANDSSLYSDAAMLERLKTGGSIDLRFTFKAAGGYGSEGSNGASCEWENIVISVNYTGAGAISGTLSTDQSSSISYSTNITNVAKGETLPISLTILPVNAITSISVRFADANHTSSGYTSNNFTVSCRAGVASSFDLNVNINDCTLTNRVESAKICVVLTTSNGTETTGWNDCGNPTVLKLINLRNAPTISVAWSDTNTTTSSIGSYIQNASTLRCAATITCDTTADSLTAVTARRLVVGGIEYEMTSDIVDIGTVDASGNVSWILYATDNHGVTGSNSGTLTVVAYRKPYLNLLSFQRYKNSEIDETSNTIWVNMGGEISSSVSSNAWTIKANYVNGNETVSGNVNMASGSAGTVLNYSKSKTLFTTSLDASNDWVITVTLQDRISSTQYTTTVSKTSALFNIEKHGVAIGMRSTGTNLSPKFESNYASTFYQPVTFSDDVTINDAVTVTGAITATGAASFQGATFGGNVSFNGTITDSNGQPINGGTDSGWVNLTLDANTCKQDTNFVTCSVRKKNGLVCIRGAVTLKTSMSSSSSATVSLLQLPVGYRPSGTMLINSGSKANYSSIQIDSDGTMKLWNRTGSPIGTSEPISISACFLE